MNLALDDNQIVEFLSSLSAQPQTAVSGTLLEDFSAMIAKSYPTVSDKACRFVENATRKRPGQPFFLYYAMTTPHNPIVPNQEFVGKSRAGAYGDFVVELDHHIGRLLRQLEELGIAENTLVIFTSDNGALAPGPPSTPCNQPTGRSATPEPSRRALRITTSISTVCALRARRKETSDPSPRRSTACSRPSTSCSTPARSTS